MKTNNDTFVKAHNRMYGNTLDCVEQLSKITFEGEEIETDLVRLCDTYHQIKQEAESFNQAGEYNINQIELAFYKWTNPFFWFWAVLYGCYVVVASLFVTSKDFSHVKK